MKKIFVLIMAILVVSSVSINAQNKTQKPAQKAATAQTVTKAAEKPAAQADKVVAAKKGPNGETVYQGAQGGQYYMNKSGNKTYLKDVDTVLQGKKGPNGEVVYEGAKGGQYYLSKSGQKIYLSQDKK
jgi:hypothetical protein